MAVGVTRAADRFAIWREAAEGDVGHLTEPDKPVVGAPPEFPPSPPVVTPPVGAIPNSNKFKTPANTLKKLLDETLDAPSVTYPEGTHPSIATWMDKHPAFTKTYLKPQYQDALKASLGEANYKKLLYHMPKPQAQALTTHTQTPAPKSNKFITPANGLNKLLANPDTSPEHVQAWMDKHPAFVKTYLHNPSYQQAIKDHVGETNYTAWAQDLQVPTPPKPAKSVAEMAGEAFAPAGFKVKTQDEFFHDHAPEGSGPQTLGPAAEKALNNPKYSPVDQDEIAKIEQEQAKIGPLTPEWAGTIGPHHNQYTDPSQLKKNEPEQFVPEDQDEIAKIKEQQAEAAPPAPAQPAAPPQDDQSYIFNDQAPLQPQVATPHPNQDLTKVPLFDILKHPKATPADVQAWFVAHPEYTPETADPLVKSLEPTLYSKWQELSGGPVDDTQPTASKHYTDLVNWVKDHGGKTELFTDPDFQKWFGSLPQADQWANKSSPSTLLQQYHQQQKKSPTPGSDEDEIGAIEKLLGPVSQPEPGFDTEAWGNKPTPVDPKDLDSLAVLMNTQHGYSTDVPDYQQWSQGLPGWQVEDFLDNPKAAHDDFDQFLDTYYDEKGKPQAPPGEGNVNLGPPDFTTMPPSKTPTDEHEMLVSGLKKIFPAGAGPQGEPLESLSVPALKAQLEAFKTHLSDTPGLESHHKQIIDLYNQVFGPGQPVSTLIGPQHMPGEGQQQTPAQPLANPFGGGSIGIAFDHDPKFQQWWDTQPSAHQDNWSTHPTNAYSQYKKDMAAAGTPVPSVNGNWANNPWEQQPAPTGGQQTISVIPPGFDAWYQKEIDDTPGMWDNETPETKKQLIHQFTQDHDYANPPTSLADDYAKAFPSMPSTISALGHESPEEQKAHLEDLLAAAGEGLPKQKLQQLLDTHFPAAPVSEVTAEAIKKELMAQGWNSTAAGFKDLDAATSPEELQIILKDWVDNNAGSMNSGGAGAAGTKAVYDKFFGGGVSGQTPAEQMYQKAFPGKNDYPAFKTWSDQAVGLTLPQALGEWAKMTPQGIENWSPGGGQYEKFHPQDPTFGNSFQDFLKSKGSTEITIPEYEALSKEYADLQDKAPGGDHFEKNLDENGVPLEHQALVTSPEFKAWFKKDNAFDLDTDDEDGSLKKMLLDPTNPWTQSKIKSYQKAQGISGKPTPQTKSPLDYKPKTDAEWQQFFDVMDANGPGKLTDSKAGWKGISDNQWTVNFTTKSPGFQKPMAAWKKLQDRVQPSGAGAIGHLTDPDQMAADWKEIFPNSSYTFKDPATPGTSFDLPTQFKNVKEVCEEFLADPTTYNGIDVAQKPAVQAFYDTYFGGGAQPSAGITVDQWSKILPGYTMWFSDKLEGKNAEEQKAFLQKYVGDYGNDDIGAAAAKALKTYFNGGGEAPAGGGTVPFQGGLDYAKEYMEATGWKNSTPEEINSGGIHYVDMTADQAKHDLEEDLKGSTWPPEAKSKIKALYDKYFGGGVPSGAGGLKPNPGADWLTKAGISPETAEDIGKQTPEKFWDNVQYTKDHWEQFDPAKNGGPANGSAWGKIVNALGGPLGDQSQIATPVGPPPYDKNAFGTEIGAILGESKDNWDYGSSDYAKKALKSHIDDMLDIDTKDALQKAYDKWFGDGNTVLDSPPPVPKQEWDPDAYQVGYHALIPGSKWTVDGQTPEQAAEKMKSILNDKIEQWGYSPQTNEQIAFYQKWFGPFSTTAKPPAGATPPPPPSPPKPKAPPFDQSTFLTQYTQIYPNTMLAPTLATAEGAKAQLELMLKKPISPQKTKGFLTQINHDKLQKLYNQWFPEGELTDLSAIQHLVEEEPESTEPAKPFKSESLNPADLTMWTENKPLTEPQWKNFATWWGNTQLAPAQEQSLYNSWFGKNATPEIATGWFQQMFEHHANPTEADLKAQGLPNWAHNTWAFGKNAETQWPIFQQWASQDPGIPKGTKLKQKLLIWNGLTATEKQQIADNYAPAVPVDTKAVLSALKKAYPDSNWSQWQTMPQGTLKANVETLAKAGMYPQAIGIYNQFFGGTIPMPKPVPKGEKAKPVVKAVPVIPQSKLPSWVKDGYGAPTQAGITDTPLGAKNYTDFCRWGESIGKGDIATGKVPDPNYSYPYPYGLLQKWKQVPDYLKAQIGAMPTMPWKTEEQFTAWKDAQPTLKDEISAIYPTVAQEFNSWSYVNSVKKLVENYLTKETDPQKKQALLGIYQKHYGVGKDTLAEALKKAAPAEKDWDKYLQITPPDVVAKLMKKKIKTEQDPEKFIQLCDIWSKFFPGPAGHKQLSNALGKNHPGGVTLKSDMLAKLWEWKKSGGDPSVGLPYYTDAGDNSPYVLQQKAINGGSVYSTITHPKFFGWTPPGETASTDYVMDPAMLGSSGATTTYAVPELAKGKEYQEVLDSLKNFESAMFSPADRAMLGSDSFQNWFQKAPKNYKDTYKTHPATLLDDFADFMNGGPAYSVVPEAADTKKLIDWSTYNLLPQMGDKDVSGKTFPPSETHNPPRENYSLEAPIIPDSQEALPLNMAPRRAPIPIYRVIPNDVLNLDASPQRAPAGFSPKQKQFFLQQQRGRLRRIDQIINGPNAQRDSKKDRDHFEAWTKDHQVPAKDVRLLEDELFSTQPILSEDDKWKHFQDWAKDHNMPEDAMYGLASKLGVGNPGDAMPGAQGNYDSPELAPLILDYVEAAGMGIHWTRSPAKAYEGIPSAGASTKASNRAPVVMVSGWWQGQGEDEGNPGGAYSPGTDSELEHSLRPGAPVFVHRVQIRDTNGDWHDLMDPGPISLWPPGRNENASGKTTKDKPSLAERLDYDLGGKHKSEEWDSLVPGKTTDEKFRQLFLDNNLMVGTGLLKPDMDQAAKWGWAGPVLTPQEKMMRDKLIKVYRQFFVGRPELRKSPANLPHVRRASLAPPGPVRGTAPEQLYDLATRWGIPDPERYGIPLEVAAPIVAHVPVPLRKPLGILLIKERL